MYYGRIIELFFFFCLTLKKWVSWGVVHVAVLADTLESRAEGYLVLKAQGLIGQHGEIPSQAKRQEIWREY